LGIYFYKIWVLLMAVSKDLISHTQLTELVKTSRLIIQSYLFNYRSDVLNLVSRNGITVTDLSYDCLAEVFSRNGENRYYIITKFLFSLNLTIQETKPINLYLAYKSFLIKVANAQLSKLYSETDPIGAKILRNIKDVVRQSDKFCITKELRGQFLTVKECYGITSSVEFPFDRLLLEFSSPDIETNTNSLLNRLHEILFNQNEYRRVISLTQTVQLFKKYFNAEEISSTEINENYFATHINSNGFEDYEIDQIRQKVENYIKKKILLDYFVKEKVTKKEAESIYLAIRDIISDWFYGVATKDSIYDYFITHHHAEKVEYVKTYKTKVEYLVKLAREEFAKYLLEEI